jgi:hypothetical protein
LSCSAASCRFDIAVWILGIAARPWRVGCIHRSADPLADVVRPHPMTATGAQGSRFLAGHLLFLDHASIGPFFDRAIIAGNGKNKVVRYHRTWYLLSAESFDPADASIAVPTPESSVPKKLYLRAA